MIRTLKQLKAAAVAHGGYTVTDNSIVLKKNTGIYWYEDRSIYRAGVALGMAKQMTVREAVCVLGLHLHGIFDRINT